MGNYTGSHLSRVNNIPPRAEVYNGGPGWASNISDGGLSSAEAAVLAETFREVRVPSRPFLSL